MCCWKSAVATILCDVPSQNPGAYRFYICMSSHCTNHVDIVVLQYDNCVEKTLMHMDLLILIHNYGITCNKYMIKWHVFILVYVSHLLRV